MKLKEYILALEQLLEEHGDIEVDTYRGGGRMEASRPSVQYRKILKGRESRPSFWYKWEGEERKGEKVVHV